MHELPVCVVLNRGVVDQVVAIVVFVVVVVVIVAAPFIVFRNVGHSSVFIFLPNPQNASASES